MDKKVFLEMIRMLKSVYGDRFFVEEKDLDAWYNLLCDLDQEDTFRDTINEWVKENKFPPTIADIRMIYKANKRPEKWQG